LFVSNQRTCQQQQPKLEWDGSESGGTFAELYGPQPADDRHEARLLRSDSERRQTSLVRLSQVVVRLQTTATRLIDTIEIIERLQRRFTKRLPGLRKSAYAERFNRLGLHSLERRHVYIDFYMVLQIVSGLVELSRDDFFHFSDSQTRGHVYKLYRNFNRTNTRMSIIVNVSSVFGISCLAV